jgi:hypothetical protein
MIAALPFIGEALCLPALFDFSQQSSIDPRLSTTIQSSGWQLNFNQTQNRD